MFQACSTFVGSFFFICCWLITVLDVLLNAFHNSVVLHILPVLLFDALMVLKYSGLFLVVKAVLLYLFWVAAHYVASHSAFA